MREQSVLQRAVQDRSRGNTLRAILEIADERRKLPRVHIEGIGAVDGNRIQARRSEFITQRLNIGQTLASVHKACTARIGISVLFDSSVQVTTPSESRSPASTAPALAYRRFQPLVFYRLHDAFGLTHFPMD